MEVLQYLIIFNPNYNKALLPKIFFFSHHIEAAFKNFSLITSNL